MILGVDDFGIYSISRMKPPQTALETATDGFRNRHRRLFVGENGNIHCSASLDHRKVCQRPRYMGPVQRILAGKCILPSILAGKCKLPSILAGKCTPLDTVDSGRTSEKSTCTVSLINISSPNAHHCHGYPIHGLHSFNSHHLKYDTTGTGIQIPWTSYSRPLPSLNSHLTRRTTLVLPSTGTPMPPHNINFFDKNTPASTHWYYL